MKTNSIAASSKRKTTVFTSEEFDTTDAAILSRALELDQTHFTPALAREILALDFSSADKTRMRELSAKVRSGRMTADEQAAMDNYERVGHFINILQSKARLSLKRATTNGKHASR